MAQVLDPKIIVKESLKLFNCGIVISCDDHIINIK
jgi:hypothetical protein